MQRLNVTIQGRATVNTTSASGLTAVGSMDGTTTAVVGWNGPWIIDGDPAEMQAQEDQVRALFPNIRISSITITPEGF